MRFLPSGKYVAFRKQFVFFPQKKKEKKVYFNKEILPFLLYL